MSTLTKYVTPKKTLTKQQKDKLRKGNFSQHYNSGGISHHHYEDGRLYYCFSYNGEHFQCSYCGKTITI